VLRPDHFASGSGGGTLRRARAALRARPPPVSVGGRAPLARPVPVQMEWRAPLARPVPVHVERRAPLSRAPPSAMDHRPPRARPPPVSAERARVNGADAVGAVDLGREHTTLLKVEK
jgi:hypothetical protein